MSTAASYVPVATTSRCGIEESVHHGAVVALGPDGEVAFAAGDPNVAIYARSALKPVQAMALLDAGLDIPDRLLAVVCASHDGSPQHVAAVVDVLAAGGLTDASLANTAALPIDPAAAACVLRAGGEPSPLLQNCSGKHAGMLVTSVVNGWRTDGYVEASHPVQQHVLALIEERAGGIRHVGIDGCGAPAAVISLAGLALAMRAVAVDRGRVQRAMCDHPRLVGGPTRDVTRLMELVPGLVAKDGAEGVFVAALPDGRAAAVKIADGAQRAVLPVVIAALRAVGVDVPAAADALAQPTLGHGRPVGTIRAGVG